MSLTSIQILTSIQLPYLQEAANRLQEVETAKGQLES